MSILDIGLWKPEFSFDCSCTISLCHKNMPRVDSHRMNYNGAEMCLDNGAAEAILEQPTTS